MSEYKGFESEYIYQEPFSITSKQKGEINLYNGKKLIEYKNSERDVIRGKMVTQVFDKGVEVRFNSGVVKYTAARSKVGGKDRQVVVNLDGNKIGYIRFVVYRDGEVGKILNQNLEEKYRGNGYNSTGLGFVAEILAWEDVKYLQADINDDNPNAVKTFKNTPRVIGDKPYLTTVANAGNSFKTYQIAL